MELKNVAFVAMASSKPEDEQDWAIAIKVTELAERSEERAVCILQVACMTKDFLARRETSKL